MSEVDINAMVCPQFHIPEPTVGGVIINTGLASLLASHGLLTNSITSLIPSMLISPIGSLLIKQMMHIIRSKSL